MKDEQFATTAYNILYIYFKIKEKGFAINYMTKFSKDANKLSTRYQINITVATIHKIKTQITENLSYHPSFSLLTSNLHLQIW